MDGLLDDVPSEAAIMEFLLHSHGEVALTHAQVSALRSLMIDLQSAMMEASSQIRKIELRQRITDSADSLDADQQTIAEAFATGAAARARANAELRRILIPAQYELTTNALARRTAAVGDQNPTQVAPADGSPKDQKVVEIEVAANIAERVLSWAKLFAWLVAVPAALLISIFTVIGMGKYSDFMKLVEESEKKLNLTVNQATTNANLLAQKVADLSEKQTESDRQLQQLTQEVREKLGFAPQSALKPDTQKRLQATFNKFQNYIISLGYSPGDSEIKVAVLRDDNTGTMAYYDRNTIYVAKQWANDPQIIYREYLHHVLYSKVGLDSNIGPERSALESGLADYLVASYTNSPRIYEQSFGTPVNLAEAQKLRPARGPEDRFQVGHIWATLFWQVRQTIGRELMDKAVYAAWFDLSRELPDMAVPREIVSRLLAHTEKKLETAVRLRMVEILKERAAPLPKTP